MRDASQRANEDVLDPVAAEQDSSYESIQFSFHFSEEADREHSQWTQECQQDNRGMLQIDELSKRNAYQSDEAPQSEIGENESRGDLAVIRV